MPGEALLAPPSGCSTVAVDGPDRRRGGGRPRRPPTRWSDWSPGRPRCRTTQAIAAAVAAARDADVAVVVVGLTEEQETESRDKATLALPGAQDALVEAVASAARRTVVVVNAATPVLMPWADRVDAVLVAGLPGQEGGHAVAAALLGSASPPAGWSPPGRPPTGRRRPGRSPRWTARCPTTRARSSGYRGHAAGAPRNRSSGSAPVSATARWDYLGARLASPTSTGRHGHAAEHRGPRLPRGRPGLLRADRRGQPVRLVGWAAADVPAGAHRRGPGAAATRGCGAGGTTAAQAWAPRTRGAVDRPRSG